MILPGGVFAIVGPKRQKIRSSRVDIVADGNWMFSAFGMSLRFISASTALQTTAGYFLTTINWWAVAQVYH